MDVELWLSLEERNTSQLVQVCNVIDCCVRFFGKIQIRILVSENGFCVSLPKSENGLIRDW